MHDADGVTRPAPWRFVPLADRHGQCRSRIRLKAHRTENVALGMIGGDMTDTADVVIFRCNAYPFCQGGEQRLLGVIHGSRVCVKMKRKSSYPLVVVGKFSKIRKAPHYDRARGGLSTCDGPISGSGRGRVVA